VLFFKTCLPFEKEKSSIDNLDFEHTNKLSAFIAKATV
jgi:hypothetical protein